MIASYEVVNSLMKNYLHIAALPNFTKLKNKILSTIRKQYQKGMMQQVNIHEGISQRLDSILHCNII